MKTTTIRLPEALHSQLKTLAKTKGLTLNALIIQTLWNVVKPNSSLA
ncbi:MAG: toxin-antitoxin system HicB family antitoxin [Oscillibacter sp.]|nr:toxin-antitoxin system HicB family antitoxin [Oscillibacter sp.]